MPLDVARAKYAANVIGHAMPEERQRAVNPTN